MARPQITHLKIKELYLKGYDYLEIHEQTNCSIARIKHVIEVVNNEVRLVQIDKMRQIKMIEERLFFLIEQEKLSKIKNKEIDELNMIYSKFLA